MNRRVVLLFILFVATGVTLALVIFAARSVERISGPLRHEVYVWQRAWLKPVRDAVSQRGTNFAVLTVLGAEISWKDRKPQLVRVPVDYETLIAMKRPVGVALRIGSFAGPFEMNDVAGLFVVVKAAALVSAGRSNQIELAELQIDFDCAESKLDEYRVWVEAIQQRVAPLPVTITTLPSWLDSRAFRRLALVATNYVLQVHSMERPVSFDASLTLCDPRAASRAVEQAGRIGVPFRVALPTYGYQLAFDTSGKYLGLSAEGPRPNWPATAQVRQVAANQNELGKLVRGWTHSRPAAMRGVIWYRLPVDGDRHNWTWRTLQRTMQGEAATGP